MSALVCNQASKFLTESKRRLPPNFGAFFVRGVQSLKVSTTLNQNLELSDFWTSNTYHSDLSS